MSEKLAYVGKIISFDPIENADQIHVATVVCGAGGKWRGVVRKGDFKLNARCTVYLPDSIVPECTEMKFLQASNWRVKMRRFRGAPSEVVIMPLNEQLDWPIGLDITAHCKVTKYIKEIPASQAGKVKGNFPSFIPKTDELNWQRENALVDALKGKPYYITEKADGTSSTAYKWQGQFGVCSRNLELEKDQKNVYWDMAIKYNLEELLPDGYAIQWETVGPGIQKNPMGFPDFTGLCFNIYDIKEKVYLPFPENLAFLERNRIQMAFCDILERGDSFAHKDLTELAKGTYRNGKPREGIVIRSQEPIGGQIISFKAINLDYET